MRGLVVLAALLMAGCSAAPEPAKTGAAPAPARAKDRTSMMPLAGRGTTRTVPDHILGFEKLPGGTVGDYESAGKKYQLFIVETDSNQTAAILLQDVKPSIGGAEYVPNMGGYAGAFQGQPVFIFAKLQYLAGVAGLPKEQADTVARELAARLR